MSAAPCPYCGNRVMPYRRYALHLRSGATCSSCGREVRLRGYVLALLAGSVLAGALIAYFIVREPGLSESLLGLAVFGILAVALDYTFWRRAGFGPTPEGAAAAHPAEHDAGVPTGA